MKPKKSAKAKANSKVGPELERIQELLRVMAEHNLEEFEYSNGNLKIRLRKPSAGLSLAVPRPWSAPEIIVPGTPQAATPATGVPRAEEGEARSTDDLYIVKSPIVGTYYEAPSPGVEPFVKVGAYVEVGQTLCIVEAMKLMNEIESDVSGEVLRVFGENGQPVEYGQPLFGIRTSRKK